MSMDLTLTPSASGKFIADNATEIKINDERVIHVAKLILAALKDGSIKAIDFDENPLHPNGDDDLALNWVLLMDTLNFSFWPNDGEEFRVAYKGTSYTGYMACAAALNRAHDNGVPVTNAKWMSTVTEAELDKVLKSDSGHSIPMIRERVAALNETGLVLADKFAGEFKNAVPKGEKSAQTFLRLILQSFWSFGDFSKFLRQKVSLLKRAQILVADVYSILKGKSEWVDFKDINTLTMFADYRVPQCLAFFGVLEYSSALREILEERRLLPFGDTLEVQLRGCSIHACDKIVEAIRELRVLGWDKTRWESYREIHAIDVDVWLWQYRREHVTEIDAYVPHHRTRSIYY